MSKSQRSLTQVLTLGALTAPARGRGGLRYGARTCSRIYTSVKLDPVRPHNRSPPLPRAGVRAPRVRTCVRERVISTLDTLIIMFSPPLPAPGEGPGVRGEFLTLKCLANTIDNHYHCVQMQRIADFSNFCFADIRRSVMDCHRDDPRSTNGLATDQAYRAAQLDHLVCTSDFFLCCCTMACSNPPSSAAERSVGFLHHAPRQPYKPTLKPPAASVGCYRN